MRLDELPPQLVREMLETGADSWISEVLRCKRQTLGQYRQRHGIPPTFGRGGARRRLERAEFVSLWKLRLSDWIMDSVEQALNGRLEGGGRRANRKNAAAGRKEPPAGAG